MLVSYKNFPNVKHFLIMRKLIWIIFDSSFDRIVRSSSTLATQIAMTYIRTSDAFS